MRIKRVISFILLITLFSVITLSLAGCKEEIPKFEKKAIIMVPGFGGSIYIDTDIGKSIAVVNDKNNNMNLENIFAILASDKVKNMGLPAYAEWVLGCDEDGKVINEIPVCNMDSDPREIDSMLSLFRPIRQYLEEKYSDYYDMIVWQYDYRKSMEETSIELENFINVNGYDKVIFYTHSMGGCLVANYLVKEENRAKVELFVPIAAPFFGTYGAESYVLSPLTNFSYRGISIDLDVTGILSNMPSIYEMLPNRGYEITGNHYYTMDGNRISADQAHSYMSMTRDWFWKQDGEGNRIEPKPMMGKLPSYDERFWTENGTDKIFISDLVPVEYVALIGFSTIIGVNFTSSGGASLVTSRDGDSTVDVISATAGHGAAAVNVHIVEGVNHINIFEDPVTEVLKAITDQHLPIINNIPSP